MSLLEESDLLRPLAHGVRDVVVPSAPGAPHRVRLLLETLAPLLEQAEFRSGLSATGGLRASEWTTPQRGSALFIENPTERPLTGSVFPAIQERTLRPHEVFVWVHDFPIGASRSYLSAYAGLVKCDARLLCAHIRPDPHAGARVFVWGEPGESRAVVLFGNRGGEEAQVTFSAEPRLYEVAQSQVIALALPLADALHLPPDPSQSLAPTLLGASWTLWPDGALEQASEWPEAGVLDGPGWWSATVSVPVATGAVLDIATGAIAALYVNGQAASPEALTLAAGANTLLLRTESAISGPLLLLDGACYVLALDRWRKREKSPGPL